MKREQHRRRADSSGDALHGVPVSRAEPAPEAAVEQDPRQLKLFNPPPKTAKPKRKVPHDAR